MNTICADTAAQQRRKFFVGLGARGINHFKPRVSTVLQQIGDGTDAVIKPLAIRRNDHRAGALAALYHAIIDEKSQRLTRGVARDFMRFAKLQFGRQERAYWIAPLFDIAAQAIGDLLIAWFGGRHE